MICPTCGSELNEGLKFCTQCGTPLETEAPVEPVAEVNTAEVIGETPVFEADAPVEAPVLEADVYSPEFAQEPVFDGNYESVPPYEATPEAFNQIPEATVEPEKPEDKKPLIFGIISLVAGVLSFIFCCCFYYVAPFFAIPAIVLGALGLKASKNTTNTAAKVLSIIGIVIAALSLLWALGGIITVIVTFLLTGTMGAVSSLGDLAYYY